MSRRTSHSAFHSRVLCALGALTAVVIFTLPRGASGAELYLARTLYYKPSELATEEGSRALYQRIAEAAAMVCPPEDSQRPDEVTVSRECQREAIARTVAKIGDARLAAIFAHRLWRYRAL